MQLLWMGLKSNTSIIYVSYTYYVNQKYFERRMFISVSVYLYAM